ncbi:methylmalonyl-CoA mutase family protein [Rhodonellum sp.]|uniref:methylmalonyl-CoA mutase family protein n=1 Tax=Rhodonellum sp. TaxID=2231180 RepID=UPI002718B426|nr:methylmalonyl-CoA mutase family protein [Rhodonellum sp.]MDO9553121.1 methylmalonyl-CoA mutase family protein [Rhodonellum sp.]
MKDKLFSDFPVTTKQDWINQAIQELKGKDFEKTLVTKTREGFSLDPFYTSEDFKSHEWTKKYQNQVNPKPEIPGISPRVWSNVVRIDVVDEKSANIEILEVLQHGADGLLLVLEGNENMDVLLQNVLPQYIQLFLCPKKNPDQALSAFFDWANDNGFEKKEIHGGLLWDGFAQALNASNDKESILDIVENLLELGLPFTRFKVFSLNSAIYHDAGGSAVQEMAFCISAFIELMDGLTERGRNPQEIFEKLLVECSVGSDYFMEIAKVRTLRVLIHQLAALYQVNLAPESIFIFANTSFWTKTTQDVQSNILRNTTEAMAAILGGSNALHVLAHDVALGAPNEFSKRMARNVSSILKEESYLDKVLDPVSGSYYLASLMSSLFYKAKDKIELLEQKGGWWMAYQNLTLQKEIKATRSERMLALVTKEETKIGVNKYVNREDSDAVPGIKRMPEDENQLKSTRQSLLAEKTNQNQG